MSNEQNPNSSLNINNNGTSILVQEKYLVQNATSISTTSGTIYTETTGKQTNNIKNDDYVILADNGNINLTSTLKDINLTTPAGNITLTAGDSSMTISSTGNTTIEGTEIEIGNSETSNIDLVSDLNITLTTDAITGIATDDIIFKSTDGEIILDTSPSTGNNAITIDNSGNVIVNGDTTTYGYQFEVNVENVSTDDTNKNGISINNIGHNDISPEIRTVYTNTAGSNKTINSLGIYSDNDPGNQYRTYTGYQYGNQIITISGNEFNANDIGRTITFEDDDRSSLITNLGKIILPTDNTFASSTVTITAGGVYTGTTDKIYMIKNDTTTTFKWSDDGGVSWQGEYIPVSYAVGQRYPLNNGVYITFSSAAGHVINDYWVIQAKITAIVNSNIIINGSITNDESSGTVVTGVTDNTVNTTTSTLGAPVFSNITGNVAISRLQEFKTSTNGLVGYVGTSTNNDLVLQTAGEPRFTITADGSLGVGQDTIDARIQTISNFNKSTLVNGNILNSNVIADNGSAVIGENSNLAGNILNFQQNPVATELRTGGYIIAYESQQNTTTEKFDIVADAFTANGDKLGSSFKINVDTTYNQSHPHLAKSGNSTSDNYMAVWTSNIGGTGYGVAAQVLSNNNEVGNENNDITVATSGYTPRVAGLSNGNYIITYCVKNGSTNKYEIRYQILNSTATSVIVSETTIANSASLHYIYPYVAALDKNDAVRPGGFVISYLKQIYTSDNRYQSVFKLFDSDGSNASSEIGITTTAVVDPGDVGANTDLSLSDSLLSVESLPSGLASNNNGGFLVCYQTNYSASVAYSDVVDSGVRNVYSVSGNGNGDLTAASIDGSTGVQTLTVSNVNGTFLVGEQIYLVGENGYLTEKIASISMLGTTATIVLSRDPRSINVARYNSNGTLVWRTTSVNESPLVLDDELTGLSSRLPEDYLRDSETNHYAFRTMATLKTNGETRALISWNNGALPSVYYRQIDLNTGSTIGEEYLLGKEILGLRQINPYVVPLLSKQNKTLGFSVVYNTSSMDLSKTAIYQELIGTDSYVAHFRNQAIDFVVDNEARLGLGTTLPNSTVHIKSYEREKTTTSTDLCDIMLENATTGIITNSDTHRLSFKSGDGDELARISVRHSSNYQGYTNPDLVAYFKLDETAGTVVAKDNGIYNIQSAGDIDETDNSIQDGQLINFDVNKCWVKGKINNGLLFNGTNSYMKIPLNNSVSNLVKTVDNITTDDFSISFWFKISGLYVANDTEMDILSYGTAEVGNVGGGGGYFQLYFRDIDSTGNLKTCFKWAENSGDSPTEVTTATKVNDTNWHHLVLTHSRGASVSTVEIYLDNENLTLSTALTAKINDAQNIIDRDIFIGAGVSGSSNFFRGILDEFRVYRSTLTSSERNRLWQYGNEARGQLVIQTAGDNTNFNDNGVGFVLDDTGKIISGSMKNQDYFILTGKLIAEPNSTTITGDDTIFLTELKPGDILYIDNVSSDLESGGIYADTLNKKLYVVNSITSNTELIINRAIPDVLATRYFSGVSVRPSIMSLFNSTDELKGFVDYNGDLVVGNGGKSSIEYAKMEIRGTGESVDDKNGLLLTNTSNTDLDTNGSRVNRLITQSRNTGDTDEVVQSMIYSSHSGTGSDNKSKIQLAVNDGTASNNIDDLTTAMTIYDNSKVNFGVVEQRDNILGDIHLKAQTNNSAKIALFSQENATGIYKESSELVFYGVDSINSTYNDTRALAKIRVSNDNPNPPDEQLVNGRIDFQVNNEVGSSLKGLKTRMTITSDGGVGIHNLRPENPFVAGPEFIDVGELITSASITGYTQSSNIISFDTGDTMFNIASNAALLRSGTIVVNDGSNLSSYVFDSAVSSTLNPTQYQIKLKSGYDLTDNDTELVGKEFNIYYPGLSVNKYGLVNIGDAGFGDENTTYHLTVSGDELVKGELHLAANIDVSDGNSSNVVIRTNDTTLQVKDDNTDGFINLVKGPKATALVETGVNRTLSWNTDSTVLVTNEATITLPTPESKYTGYYFTIKNTGGTEDTITIVGAGGETIDGVATYTLPSQYDSVQVQTNGTNWYILNKISKKKISSVDTITVASTNSGSRTELITDSLEASTKSIILPDTADNGGTLYFHSNLGSTTGEMMHLFYYNANSSGTANIDFGTSNIYGGDGSGTFLEFSTSGQAATLIYIDNADATIKGWRIINTGATFS